MMYGKFGFFLLGLCSKLYLFGSSLSITELIAFAVAPFVVFKEYPIMKRNGFATLFWLSILVIINAAISCWVNHTHPMFVLRGMATVCLLPCTIVLSHWVIRKNLNGFKWTLIGLVFSGIINIFAFQNSVEVHAWAGDQTGIAAATGIMSGPLFWISRIKPVVMLFPQGWYLHCPGIVCIICALGFAAFSLMSTESGRSVALTAFAASVLVVIGGKKRETISRRICKNIGLIAIIGVVSIVAFKLVYQYTASHGMLGEKAQLKYENQTKGNTSFTALLLGGRYDSFSGIPAALDKPILGFGPWAMDMNDYTDEFLRKYGNAEDYAYRMKIKALAHKDGRAIYQMIGCHSHIVEFWVWYGICGLIFWLYVIFICIRHFVQDCYAVPQWFMWIACAIPKLLWDVFFSPLGDRFEEMFILSAILMARAVQKGKVRLPWEMEKEIESVH